MEITIGTVRACEILGGVARNCDSIESGAPDIWWFLSSARPE
jgi:hypothetical protein